MTPPFSFYFNHQGNYSTSTAGLAPKDAFSSDNVQCVKHFEHFLLVFCFWPPLTGFPLNLENLENLEFQQFSGKPWKTGLPWPKPGKDYPNLEFCSIYIDFLVIFFQLWAFRVPFFGPYYLRQSLTILLCLWLFGC